MARRPRFALTGVAQHIIQRGINNEPCFFCHKDYIAYLTILRETSVKYGCRVHAYVLMKNHVHLLLTPCATDGVPKMMQSLGRQYVHYFNQRYTRTGTLWQGRYKASLVESETYLLRCYRYIESNPVRSGLASSPGEYVWTSYHANAGGMYDRNLLAHDQYLALGNTVEQRCQVYRKQFRYAMDETVLREIRDAINQELVLGSEMFKDWVEAYLQRSARRRQPGRPSVREISAYYFAY